MTIPDLNLTRLPKWAQEHIATLVRERDQARAAHKEALLDSNPEATNTRLVSTLMRSEVGLPNYANVRHYLPNQLANDRTYIDTRIERNFTKRHEPPAEQLVIMGSGRLSLSLSSSNLFLVDVIDR